MKKRTLVPAATAALLLGFMAFLTGCDVGGGGDGGGGGGGELKLARVDPSTYMPQYTDAYIKSVFQGAKPASDSSSDCGGRVTFDGDKKCKDSTPVTAPDNSGQQAQQPQLQPSQPEQKQKTEPPTPEAQACEQALSKYKQDGSGCAKHATRSLIWAGIKGAVSAQTSFKGMATMALASAAGYALAALTGVGTLGLLAKVGYWLLIGGGIASALLLVKHGYDTYKVMRDHPVGTVEHAEAVRNLSQIVATLVFMILAAGGPKAMEMLKAKAPVAPVAAQAEPAAAAASSAAKSAGQKLLGTKQITDPRRLLTAGKPDMGFPGKPPAGL